MGRGLGVGWGEGWGWGVGVGGWGWWVYGFQARLAYSSIGISTTWYRVFTLLSVRSVKHILKMSILWSPFLTICVRWVWCDGVNDCDPVLKLNSNFCDHAARLLIVFHIFSQSLLVSIWEYTLVASKRRVVKHENTCEWSATNATSRMFSPCLRLCDYLGQEGIVYGFH